METLKDFAQRQTEFVRKYAADCHKLQMLKPEFDLEKHFKALKVGNPMLLGVSLEEVIEEMHTPGSF